MYTLIFVTLSKDVFYNVFCSLKKLSKRVFTSKKRNLKPQKRSVPALRRLRQDHKPEVYKVTPRLKKEELGLTERQTEHYVF
jgi:hypothetical protein